MIAVRFWLILLSLFPGLVLAQKKNSGKIPQVSVVDTPVIDWTSYPGDSIHIVGTNIQTFTAHIHSRLPLSKVEIQVNGIISDQYKESDFSPAVADNQYDQVIERTITLRTGNNSIMLIASNSKGVQTSSKRSVVVDPAKISVLRSEKDRNAPMIYISAPSNIREDKVLIYEDMVKLTGTVIDESGVQLLKVNGLTVPVKENGAFAVYLPLNMGENSMTIEAKDINQNIALKKFLIDRRNADGSAYNHENARNYLLVIGVNDYKQMPQLNNAVSDVLAVREVLTSEYKFDKDNVTLLINNQATRANIYSALRSYIEKVTPQDNLMIYFSGHGYFDKLLNEGYWIPVDAQNNDASSYVSNAQVLKIIENINSQHTFLVADACFSGSLFASSTRGYSDHVEKYKSRWGLASGRLEVVSDGTQGTNSPFAQGFIEFLETNTESKVPVSDLIQYVKKKVAETNEQTPIGSPLKGVGDEGGEFVFYKRQ